ncbi:MAG: glycosyltransferase [Thalassobaculum sp.]|uniref:glycosyltransferase n=1 Tax=Thalassobaculum sp. TaxID=2022740 RepID=UPI0032ECE40F
MVAAGLPADADPTMPGPTAPDLRIDGRPATGGWLFHRGNTADGGVRFTWIGRTGEAGRRAVGLAVGTDKGARDPLPAAPAGLLSITDYLSGYAAIGDRIGLVRQLVESAPSVLHVKGHEAFEALRIEALRTILAEATQQSPATLFTLPGNMKLALIGEPSEPVEAVAVLDAGRVTRSPFRPVGFTVNGRRQTALLVPAGGRAVAALLGRHSIVSVRLGRAVSRQGPGDLSALLRGQPGWGADLIRYLLTVLAPYASGQPEIAGLLDELAALMPPTPVPAPVADGAPAVSLSTAFAAPGGSLVVTGTLHDPDGLIARLEWTAGGAMTVAIDRAALLCTPSPGPASGHRLGFVATAAVPSAAQRFRQHRFDVVLRSGARVETVAPPVPSGSAAARDVLLRFLHEHPADDRLFARLQPLVAELHAAHLARPRIAEDLAVGELPPDPPVTVVIPLYRTLTFLRHQAIAFALDPAMREAEVILVLDSPEQRDELLAILDGLGATYGFSARVLVHSANLGYAPAVNTGAAAARAPKLVRMNSDVVPADDRWLPALLRRFRRSRRVGAAGPKLLYGDDSLQHAGLTFARDREGRYYNTHFYKGYPRNYPEARRARAVPALTGACLMLDTAVYRSLGGMCEDYVVGDFEDSDLSLRLAAEGLRLWYEPAAELYHYERESIVRNASYTDTAACRYNQYIHTTRWKSQLQRVINLNLRLSSSVAMGRG